MPADISYIVLEADSPYMLSQEVEKYLTRGWRLRGDLHVIQEWDVASVFNLGHAISGLPLPATIRYHQPMVK